MCRRQRRRRVAASTKSGPGAGIVSWSRITATIDVPVRLRYCAVCDRRAGGRRSCGDRHPVERQSFDALHRARPTLRPAERRGCSPTSPRLRCRARAIVRQVSASCAVVEREILPSASVRDHRDALAPSRRELVANPHAGQLHLGDLAHRCSRTESTELDHRRQPPVESPEGAGAVRLRRRCGQTPGRCHDVACGRTPGRCTTSRVVGRPGVVQTTSSAESPRR